MRETSQDLDSDVEAIVAWLEPIRGDIEIVGLEAGTLTQYLTYGIQAAEYPIVCMEARGVHVALAAMRNKTDKNDARGIAQTLRTGWYRTVHVKSIEGHHIRALLSSRKAVLNKCIDLENEVRGLFMVFGIKLPPKLKHGAFDGAVRETIKSDPALCHALLPLLGARLVLYRTSALTFKAAVDDPKRFKRSRTVAAHFGLTPRRFQSGEMDNMGHISKAGDRDVRIVLYARSQRIADENNRVVTDQGLGHAADEDRGAQTRTRCGVSQTRRHPASHVDRQQRFPMGC